MAVRYLAATYGVEIGGDFYDVAPLPGDHVAIAVGDVVGHDITAAATMGQLRSVYRALLVEAPAPAAVIDRLQASWPLLGLQRMATALFATLDLPTGMLHVASAGHPPPLLVVDGRAEFLPVVPSRMLGAPPAPAVEWTGALPRGATLVLFTDGLVESRSEDLDAGWPGCRKPRADGWRPTRTSSATGCSATWPAATARTTSRCSPSPATPEPRFRRRTSSQVSAPKPGAAVRPR